MQNLEYVLAETIAAGLHRRTITTCSKWSENYRIMGQPFPGKWSFDHHPWLREMHDCEAELIIGQKSAQMGYTETALNKVFFNIDVKGISALYVLPASKPDASDFSTARFDPALEMSPHLRSMFSDVKNIGHKRAGNANLYVRGSRSRPQLKSLPAGLLICDELDEMVQENIKLAFERMSGQLEKQAFLLSTPTIDNYGINRYFNASTKDHYFFKCPCCSKKIELTFPNCIVITADDPTDLGIRDTYLICPECEGTLPHEGKIDYLQDGEWVGEFPERPSRGFYINQLYSMTVKPYELALLYLESITSPTDEQEFFNSKLGLPHVIEGARVLDSDLDDCTGTHKKTQRGRQNAIITMGVDVGKILHYTVIEWYIDNTGLSTDINLLAKAKVIMEGRLNEFEELDGKMQDYGVNFCVIDANPETRKAREFARRFWGMVKLCIYARGVVGKEITIKPEVEHMINVDRTSWLDLSLGRFRRGAISIPADTSREYREHIKAPVRVYKKDAEGNPVGSYVNGGDADHLAHANNYAEIALPLCMSLLTSQNIQGIL